jgi:hypothetical protein
VKALAHADAAARLFGDAVALLLGQRMQAHDTPANRDRHRARANVKPNCCGTVARRAR